VIQHMWEPGQYFKFLPRTAVILSTSLGPSMLHRGRVKWHTLASGKCLVGHYSMHRKRPVTHIQENSGAGYLVPRDVGGSGHVPSMSMSMRWAARRTCSSAPSISIRDSTKLSSLALLLRRID
jgi:hypothetical protein